MPPASVVVGAASTGRRGIEDSCERTERCSLANSPEAFDASAACEREAGADEDSERECFVPDGVLSPSPRPLRRFRPPRRPRRRRPLSVDCFSLAGDFAVASTGCVSFSDSDSEDSVDIVSAGAEAVASKIMALSSNGAPSSGTGSTGGRSCGKSSCESPVPVGSPPSRVAACCAFVFQSARRKRVAAVVYHLAASAFWLAVSNTRANSKATIASCVFSKSVDSCAAGSLPVRARRMRAVICFQSAIRELLYRIVAATKPGYQCGPFLFAALCRNADWTVAKMHELPSA